MVTVEMDNQLKTVLQSTLGNHLRAIRTSKKLRQKEVAYLCDFTRSGYNLIEKGKRNVTIFSLLKISQALEVPLEDLFKFKLKSK